MKVHYANILLLYSVNLSILLISCHINMQKNHYISARHAPNTTKILTTRLLCECELYSPVNYDNDPQMKAVMENFSKQTQERFHEYDDRMIEKRKRCKDKCDKEIQKIILKDKLEKELMDKISMLHTDIQSDAIPTCVCEKSVADKVEKGCLRCGGVLGGGVAPSVGILGGIGEAAISVLQPLAVTAAENAAKDAATALATQAGIKAVKLKIKGSSIFYEQHEIARFISIVNEKNFYSASALRESVVNLFSETCKNDGGSRSIFCSIMVNNSQDVTFNGYVKPGMDAFQTTLTTETTTLTKAKVGAVEATYGGYHISIIASIVAIVVIVLIMVIIYLILRYRRKKKMKKKLQYLKLLKE
ncbi:rifin PIR protein, putative [Plasmodium reichenowi]|uniref:Rifin PIR protein, putative n=1 Tax=Plasmodium reichenowi TaxID=5854 RepID=A0A2P9D5R1_PLARE|nr:rifin PIR protein, putative [Plasmodium reichenowi]